MKKLKNISSENQHGNCFKVTTEKEYTSNEMYKMFLKHKNRNPWDEVFDGVLEEDFEK